MIKFHPFILATSVLLTVACSSESSKPEESKPGEKETTTLKDIIEPSKNNRSMPELNLKNDEATQTAPLNNGEEPIPPAPIEVWPEEGEEPTTSPVVIQPIDVVDNYDFHKYEKLNSFLKKYVSATGKVNYSSIKSNKGSLAAILKEFESNYQKSSWSKNQKLAYWINVYNMYTIKLVVDNYPTSSITKITSEPWQKKFIKLGGNTLSLAHVENEIIRKKFNEPRIHFALNCASKSCPVLLNSAYTSGNVQSKLTSQTKRFLNDYSKNYFGKKEISISKIFEWYAADFTKSGTVIDFINKYRTEQLKSPKIKYKEYSWDLNN
ncbi:MAG: DUF547 domain-containing protein [Crocinitomicaceae bacterium]|nr:DUF547 domain-containing protein [Crocinitomicaceae bacterium]